MFVYIPFVPEAGCCNLEGGISLETRPSSSSLSESEITSGGLGTQTPADLSCWAKPLGPRDGKSKSECVSPKH